VSAGTPNPVTDHLPPRPLGAAPALKEAAGPRAGGRMRRRWSPAGMLGRGATYLVLCAGAALLLFPFAFLVSSSLKTRAEVSTSKLALAPASPQWQNYPESLAMMNFRTALANTLVITAMSVAGQVISSSLVGFGFARFRFRGRDALFVVMLSTMMLPAQVTMIPVFVLFRWLGMVDTIWPLVIPMWLASPFYVFMFRQFFSQIPEELMEAARIDGAGNWTIYWRLMLPLSGPVVAIVAIYTFLFVWNDFMGPLIYLNSPDNRTLALALNAFKGQYGVTNLHLLMAASVVTMLPCVLLFFAMQRYFVESVAATGMK
jgi:multiple sugar transport system permease protein